MFTELLGVSTEASADAPPELSVQEEERAAPRLPIHLRGRMPAAPPKQGSRFLGDYGQRSGVPQRASSFKTRTSLSFGRKLVSHQTSVATSKAGDAGTMRGAGNERDASSRTAEEEEQPGDENAAVERGGGESKKVGAAEENVPRGQAHAGEEGRVVAAKAVASEAPLSPSSPAMRTLVREQLKELALL